MKRIIYYLNLALLAVALSCGIYPMRAAAQEAVLPPVIITEVQTGGLADGVEEGRLEFVELYNPYDVPISLEGWRLEYLSAGHNGIGPPTRVLALLSGSLPATSFTVASHLSYMPAANFALASPEVLPSSGLLARSGGQLRVVSPPGQVIDMVTWGAATGSDNWWKSPEIPPGQSIQRSLPGDDDYTAGFTYRMPTPEVTPGMRGLMPEEQEPPTIQPTPCTTLQLTEIMPNATGTDNGKEFVEVHNFGEAAVAMGECRLQVGSSIYQLPAEPLAPGAYLALSDSQTGITLPNTTAQAVRLLTAAGEQSVTYANDLPDDTAWAFIDGAWQATTAPTPGAANIPSPASGDKEPVAATTVQPCGPGKERNPETNRCRNTPVMKLAVTCPPGQERNLATNRCRMIAAATSTLVPCKPNQERSPVTNRCRAVQATGTAPKPCPQGQERNPQTNRCRKSTAVAASHFAAVTDVPGSTLANNYRWWIAISVLLGAAAYAVYEWRHDLANALHHLKVRRSQK